MRQDNNDNNPTTILHWNLLTAIGKRLHAFNLHLLTNLSTHPFETAIPVLDNIVDDIGAGGHFTQ